MKKHILDRPRAVSNDPIRRAVAIERQTKPRLETLLLQRRDCTRIGAPRAQYYAQFARRKSHQE